MFLWGMGPVPSWRSRLMMRRDYAFAETYDLPIVEVVTGGDIKREAYTGEGTGINSSNAEVSLNGLATPEAKQTIVALAVATRAAGRATVQYKLRDWLFSRQRYWGEPIPIMHLDDGTMEPLAEEDLPLLLPDLAKFQPSGTTESPLALAEEWVTVTDPVNRATGAARDQHDAPVGRILLVLSPVHRS